MPAASDNFDLVIIGGGPGGYTAAIRAQQLGLKTALVEREHLGGICLNWGCIPTKALLRSAQLYRDIQHAKEHGFDLPGPATIDMQRLVARSRDIAGQLSSGVRYLMKKNKVTLFDGSAALGAADAQGLRAVNVEDPAGAATTLRVILATGARARTLPGIEADPAHIWTYREALTPQALPRSLLVIGSGAIGIEFGCFYRALGAEVTVVEALDRILPAEDEEISALARASFERQGMRFHVGSRIETLARSDAGVTATLRGPAGSPGQIVAERVILAIGIRGNVENLGLEQTRGASRTPMC